MRELGLDPAKVNVNGGAIAIGPPARRLAGRGSSPRCSTRCGAAARGYGLATMCIGVGQGIAAVFEAVE